MRQSIVFILLMGAAHVVVADVLTRSNGDVDQGLFGGYGKHQMIFQKADGAEIREFAYNIRNVTVDPCPLVSVETINKRWESAVFKGYENHAVRLEDASGEARVPATMLKAITILKRQDKPDAAAQEPVVEPPPTPAQEVVRAVGGGARMATAVNATGTREWNQSGKWREMESPGVPVISRGEDVDIESKIKKGVVNVVHFHYAAAHSSVRQGNYIEVLARKSGGRVLVSRVIINNFDAPICEAKDITALPQFWFYSRSGKLTRKLTERFTESDIDVAMKQALQQM